MILKPYNAMLAERSPTMEADKTSQPKKRFVLVKDKDGTEFVCRMRDLKKIDELTEEEKAACFPPPPAFE
jgi:hypothetical protein